ncbi:MAG: nicotinate-nucleotide diphosphorylase (carboxylating), partial [Candidatus Melainabacteria bacterium]|nr:nicotinate-nucleotide diphosphorylase (carboxylating) [Candidatus Melainabacteria bacterium]
MAVLDRSAMEDKIISDALVEDIGLGDITTDSIVLENKISKFNLFINQKAIISGLNVFQRVFQLLDPMISCKPHCENGDELQEKGLVCTLNGNAKNILKGE